MKKHKKLIISSLIAAIVVAAILTGIIMTAGGGLDVVQKYAIRSFAAVAENSDIQKKDENWTLISPDGEAVLVWGKGEYTVAFELNLTPFLNAGLNVGALPDGYQAADGKLILGAKYGETEISSNAVTSMESIVKGYRSKLGYHMAMGHFNVDLGNGNAFEWAQDIGSNDKDIVFALNPEPLIAAGVTPERVEGWVYGKVEMHKDGKTVEEFMLLKPFDLA